MDLNENLRQLRELTASIDQQAGRWADEDRETFAKAAIGESIAILFAGLDDWLSKGIALPDDWAKNQSFLNRGSGQPCPTCETYHRNCP